METRVRDLIDNVLEPCCEEITGNELCHLGLFRVLEFVMQGETESVKERLWHADGEAVVVSLGSLDHHDAGTVDLQVVPLVQGMQVFDLSV